MEDVVDFAPTTPTKELTSQLAISSSEILRLERDSILDSNEFREEMLSPNTLKTNLKEKERLSTLSEYDGSQASNNRK